MLPKCDGHNYFLETAALSTTVHYSACPTSSKDAVTESAELSPVGSITGKICTVFSVQNHLGQPPG